MCAKSQIHETKCDMPHGFFGNIVSLSGFFIFIIRARHVLCSKESLVHEVLLYKPSNQSKTHFFFNSVLKKKFQVCLVERKEDKRVLAMKYVNKQLCVRQNALKNVMEEVQFLRELDHPFIVGLWYTFQVKSLKYKRRKYPLFSINIFFRMLKICSS